MIKYSGILSILLGILVNLLLFVDNLSLAIGFTTVIPVFILSIIGTVFAIIGFIKLTNWYSYVICGIGCTINILPIAYFIFFIFAIG
ncbi:hypothetical protein IGI47_000817 [Enterococcus sp. AZ191]|uniref:hypothetical protein n=1 Tax=Enterococcus sp. AZ191 TaxID=2774639 RepID=UPI003F27C8F3